jgi:HK97 family phage major capsid protein
MDKNKKMPVYRDVEVVDTKGNPVTLRFAGGRLKLPELHRTVEFTRAETGDGPLVDDAGRYQVCLSSEAPVERWFGAEILDHTKESIDLARFARGIALLVNHNTDDQVGLIEDPEIGEDRKLRGWARFGRSARAMEIKQDVDDGIRNEMSVGYRVRKMVMESSDDETGETYRATSWCPMEGSLVPIPADIEVGVGRSENEGALPAEVEVKTLTKAPETGTKEVRMETNGAPAQGTSGGNVTATVGRDRGAEAVEISRLATEHKMTDRTAKWLAEGKTPDQVKDEILTVLTAAAERTATAASGALVDLSDKDKRRYSLSRAIIGASDQKERQWTGLEREVSDAIRVKLERRGIQGRANGFYVPTIGLDIDPTPEMRATLIAGTSSLGGAAVFTEPMGFIEVLRNLLTVRAAGARVLTGLSGPAAFPRQKTAATASWSSEAPGSAVSASNPTFDQLVLNPTALQSVVAYSRMSLLQISPDIDNIVRQDIAMLHALAIDLAAIQGTGSTQPTGITQTSGIGSVTIGANGGAVTYTQPVALEKTVEAANALRGKLAYLTTPTVKQTLRLTQKLSNTIGVPVWEGGQPGNINGYQAFATNQVPSNLTKGTSTTVCHALIYGNFEELFIGEFGAFEIITDPYTLADKNSIRLVSFQLADVGVRHAASFAADLDIV